MAACAREFSKRDWHSMTGECMSASILAWADDGHRRIVPIQHDGEGAEKHVVPHVHVCHLWLPDVGFHTSVYALVSRR